MVKFVVVAALFFAGCSEEYAGFRVERKHFLMGCTEARFDKELKLLNADVFVLRAGANVVSTDTVVVGGVGQFCQYLAVEEDGGKLRVYSRQVLAARFAGGK